MGQGIRTALTSVIADELEANWNRVIIKQGTGDEKYGDQNTDGSKSVRLLYQTMREMGASVKQMLIEAASRTWSVPISECRAENHFIIHSDGRKLEYGELVELAKTFEVPEKITLKSPKDFRRRIYLNRMLRTSAHID